MKVTKSHLRKIIREEISELPPPSGVAEEFKASPRLNDALHLALVEFAESTPTMEPARRDLVVETALDSIRRGWHNRIKPS